jgi:hypothetical protein
VTVARNAFDDAMLWIDVEDGSRLDRYGCSKPQ